MDVVTKNNVRIVGAEDGPTIVLAHGFGCDQNLWRLIVERLAPTFRLVLFDHVGAGASDPAAWQEQRYASLDGYAADILDIVGELDLRDVIFVGHSVAAMIGVLTIAADPTRFVKLVLLTEARIGVGSERYDDRNALLEFAAAHSPSTAAAIVADVRSLLHSFGAGLEDDVAVLALGVPAGR